MTLYFYHQTSDLVRYSNWVQIETFAIWVDIYYPIPNNLSPRGSVTKYRRRIAKRDFAQKIFLLRFLPKLCGAADDTFIKAGYTCHTITDLFDFSSH